MNRIPSYLFTVLFVLVGVVMAVSVAFASAITQFGREGAQLSVVDMAGTKFAPVNSVITNCIEWVVVPSVNPSTFGNPLNGVAAVSSSDVWAVGSYYNYAHNTTRETLIEHWDGSAWSVVSSPNVGTRDNQLFEVTALGSSDVWAVGNYIDSTTSVNMTLIMHWNGSAWSVVPSVNPSTSDNNLYGITAIASNNVWAVGSYYDAAAHIRHTLIEHWDGSVWSLVTGPALSVAVADFSDVSALSSNDIWAVGDYAETLTSTFKTLVSHWNGSTWSVVPSPNQGTDSNRLSAVTAISNNDVWAVGSYATGTQVNQTLVEHWDGNSWSIVSSPNSGTQANSLVGIDAVSATDVWAVGISRNTSGYSQTLVEHWNGTTWSVVASPNPGNGDDALRGIAVVLSGDAWAVGDSCCPDYSLIERLGACVSTPTPTLTPTPEPPPCPGERFTDVCSGDYFYAPVLSLNDDSIVSGYNTAPPCNNGLWVPCFKPYNSSSRGQISKIVSLAANFSEPVTGQLFEDVQPGSTFYEYVQRMATREIVNGYPCGGPGEPCGAGNLPYFRTNANVTRGQLSKFVANAFGWTDPVSGQQFQDVAIGSTFYEFIGRLVSRSIINGYTCGDAGEPCVEPGNLPYFRPGNDVTRGQTAKIVELARTQATPTPTITATPVATFTATSTAVATATVTATPTESSATATPTP